ncbi:MAG: PDZ domain-containing protein [Nannocystaceae bacterium]
MKIHASLLLGAAVALLAPTASWAAAPTPPSPPAAPALPPAGHHAPAAPVAPAPPSFPGGIAAPAPPPPAPGVFGVAVDPDGSSSLRWSFGHDEARLGTQVSSMSSELREFFGAPPDAGILVQRVEPGSAAEGAKVKVGDVLVEIDGRPVRQATDVRAALSSRSGQQVRLVVVRKGKRKTLKAAMPEPTSGPSGSSMRLPTIPPIELPPEVERLLTPEQRQQLQRELDSAREQLRDAERRLRQLDREAVRDREADARPRAKPKPKSRKELRRDRSD